MKQQSSPNQLASLEPTALAPDSFDCSLISQELAPLVRTPRCLTFKKEQVFPPSQKQGSVPSSKTQKARLPSLSRVRTDLKENLLDLDLYFDPEPSELCQHGQQQGSQERQSFVIRKLRAPSASSKGRRTATGSEESSLDLKKESHEKSATDQLSKNNSSARGKSESKHVLTCRVVNSKKLPFDLQSQRQKKKAGRQDLALEVSAILRREEDGPLLSAESFEDLCQYF